MAQRRNSRNGFARTGKVLANQVRVASQGRGFEKSQLLTHWEEIVGPDIAAISRPVQIKYGRQGVGATLTVLTNGANAPMLEMQKEAIRTKVNALYGYPAISYIRLTQTASHGFSEGQAVFQPRAEKTEKTTSDTAKRAAASATAEVQSSDLRDALTRLGSHIIDKEKKGTHT